MCVAVAAAAAVAGGGGRQRRASAKAAAVLVGQGEKITAENVLWWQVWRRLQVAAFDTTSDFADALRRAMVRACGCAGDAVRLCDVCPGARRQTGHINGPLMTQPKAIE